jgi:hypothetical protein
VVELQGDYIRPIISSDEMDAMKNEKKFWHPVPRLAIINRSKNVHFKQFFFILENFFVSNLESDIIVFKDLSSKNKYEFRRLHIDLQVLVSWFEPAPRIYDLVVNDVCIFYGEKQVNPQPFIPFDEDILSYPFWKDLEVTQGVFILEVTNLNEVMLEKFYFQSEVTIFASYRIVRDFKKFSIFACLTQLSLDELKHSADWNYPLDYLTNKEEWIFSGAITRELLKMVFSFYDFYDRLSFAFPSESYVKNNSEDYKIKLIKREGTHIINDEGEFIGSMMSLKMILTLLI